MSNRRGEKVLNFGAISRLAEYRSILSSCFHSMKERPLLFNHYYKIEEKCLNWSGHIMWILLIHRHLSECKICQIMSSRNGWGTWELVLTFLFGLASFWCNIWHLCSCQINHTAEIINTDRNFFFQRQSDFVELSSISNWLNQIIWWDKTGQCKFIVHILLEWCLPELSCFSTPGIWEFC